MSRYRITQGVLAVVILVSAVFAQQRAEKKHDRKEPTPGNRVLWTNPGNVTGLDLKYGVGGAQRQPRPPFRFIKEDLSGTTPKVNVTDSRGVTWDVKWGREARPSTFCTRLAWACGYFASPEYFISEGQIEDAHGLTRARGRISRDGSFKDARFQLRPDSPKFLKNSKWTWEANPFSRSHELQGLKLLTMIVSNADAKNANLGTFVDEEGGSPRYLYAVIDWGSSLGKWGNSFTASAWNCEAFADQTPKFVKGVKDGLVRFGFSGKHESDLSDDITVSDVQWLMQYLGEISDAQIRDGFAASGANPDETECFARSLRNRIEQLRSVIESPQERQPK